MSHRYFHYLVYALAYLMLAQTAFSKDKKSSQSSKQGSQEQESKPRSKSFFDNKLAIATSYSLSHVNKGSVNWRASGASDLTVSYKIKKKILGKTTKVSFRYIAMDIAPSTETQPRQDFTGVIESYYFGGMLKFPIKKVMNKKLSLDASSELGLTKTTIKNKLNLKDPSYSNNFSALLSVGAVANWQVLDKLNLGPQLRLAVGGYTTIQFGVNAAFAF